MECGRGRRACPYLIGEGEGAVNVQPVVSLQLQQRVSQQLLEEQREGERSGGRTVAVFWGGRQQKEGAADVGQVPGGFSQVIRVSINASTNLFIHHRST